MGDWAFQYDTLNRLLPAAPADNAPSSYIHAVACFGYDGFGNRTKAAFDTASSGWPAAGATWQGATPNCSAPTAANGFTLQALYLRGGAGDQDVEIDPAQGSNPAG